LVSTTLAWDELDDSLQPAPFDTVTVPARLAALARDPWAELDGLPQSIHAAASHLDVAL